MLGKNSYLSDPDSLHSHASTSIAGHEILLTHHQDLLSAHYLPPHAPPVSDPAVGYGNDGVDPPPRTAKKDRHSKIHTAQGPRDRRVRLSIGVARKFFDLQEVLGFDKPSKTLDWLLTKSRAAIKHLVSTKTSVASSLTDNNNPAEEPQLLTKKEKSSKRKKGGVKDAQQLAAMNLAKESRVKARARARERTREKMCIKQQQQQQMEIQVAAAAAGNCYHQDSMPAHNYINRPPLAFGFQFHHQGYAFPYNLTEGWDISANLASQSSFTAVLDHPKFNISYSND